MSKRKQMLEAQLFRHLLRAEEYFLQKHWAANQPSAAEPSPYPVSGAGWALLGSRRGKWGAMASINDRMVENIQGLQSTICPCSLCASCQFERQSHIPQFYWRPETLNLHHYVKENPNCPRNHVGSWCWKGMPFGEQKMLGHKEPKSLPAGLA